jgi:steroid 5-alpha reductase family enzyme
LPFLPATANPTARLTGWDLTGILVCGLALSMESLSDRQLKRFRRNPANQGRTCREGWWRYSRHPNYFFEWIYWWGFLLIDLGGPGGWLGATGPVFMLLFLLFLTGIPYTEKRALQTRGEDYRAYQRTTSRFIPWFPRKDPS